MLPFTLSFLDDVVPDNYRLPVTASVSGGNMTAPNIYRPLYKDWEIQKFVNSNRIGAFGKDGAEVVVTPQEEGGNPYLDDLTYVDFAFIVNKYTNDQCGLADLRDACSVTLTDTLPTYTDRNGVSRIAVFDADQNPGWTLSEDGKTVSRTYTGEHSAEILLQIYNDALHLRFPGLQFTALAGGTLEADLDNTVHLEAIPSGEAPGETHPETDDPLRFRLTTDPTAQGKFAKGAEKGDIYDVEGYKTNPYPWSLALSNGKSQPLRHIVIQDRTIVEDGETNDKIAYAFFDAAIIAAQSMYAEKFIAPAGSDSWSKQGLLVKAGSNFDYLLEIVNETAAVHTGLTVYDTLPCIGDPNLFGASGRVSEFPSACAAPSRRRRAIRSITPPARRSTPTPWRRWWTPISGRPRSPALRPSPPSSSSPGKGPSWPGTQDSRSGSRYARRRPSIRTPWTSCARRSIRIRPAARSRGCRPSMPSASGPCRPPRSRNPTRSGPGCASRASA